MTWLLGAYYFDESAQEEGKANLAIGTFAALEALTLPAGTTWCGLPGSNPRAIAACPPPLRFGGAGNPNNVGVDVGVDLFTRVANESVALFGQGTFDITDRLSVTAGVRWTQDDKEVQLVHFREASGRYVVGAPGTQDTFKEEWSEVTPKLGLELQLTDDALLYVSTRRVTRAADSMHARCPASRKFKRLTIPNSSTATKSARRRAGGTGA